MSAFGTARILGWGTTPSSTIPRVGTVFSDDFARASIGSNYTNTSDAFSCNGSEGVAVNNVDDTWNKKLVYSLNSYRSSFERFTVTLKSNVGALDGKGLAIGIDGIHFNLQIRMDLNGAAAGKIKFFNVTGTNPIQTSAAALTLNTNDRLVTTVQNHKGTYIVTVRNIDTPGTITDTLRFSLFSPIGSPPVLTPGYFELSLYATGGTQTFTEWSYYSPAVIGAPLLGIGDSNMLGLFAETTWNRYFERVAGVTQEWNLYGGPGLKTGEFNLTEIVNLAPAKAFICLGTNDYANSVPISTSMANLAAMVTALENAGIVVKMAQIPPINTVDVTPFNAQLVTDFGSRVVVNLFTLLKASSGTGMDPLKSPDGLHINAITQPDVATLVTANI